MCVSQLLIQTASHLQGQMPARQPLTEYMGTDDGWMHVRTAVDLKQQGHEAYACMYVCSVSRLL